MIAKRDGQTRKPCRVQTTGFQSRNPQHLVAAKVVVDALNPSAWHQGTASLIHGTRWPRMAPAF